MGTKTQHNVVEATKAEVGEIDTRAPFASVKAAVSLFGEGAFSPYKPTARKPKSQPLERPLVKETELHLAQKDLNKLKEQLKNCETTRLQALTELERAKRTVDDLTEKLKTVSASREVALNVTESAKAKIRQLEEVGSSSPAGTGGPWKIELENAREQYAAAMTELDAAKQELRRIKKDFETSMEAKVAALEQEEVAKRLANANTERVTQLSKELAAVQESFVHVKTASIQAKQEESNLLAEKDSSRQSHKSALEETEKRLASLRKEFDPGFAAGLEAKLSETTAELGAVQKEIENAKVADRNYVAAVTTDLDGAKNVLQKVAEEEFALRSQLESLKLELGKVKKEHLELKEKEAETESVAADLNFKLQQSKLELEAAIAGESKARDACDELLSTIRKLSSDSETAKNDAEIAKKEAEELRKEAEETRNALKEAEQRLQEALKNAEAAKVAEANALNQIKDLAEKTNAARSSTSESGAQITISTEEFQSLSRKVEESESLAEMKVGAALAQVDAVKASENESRKKLESCHKEMEEIEAATGEALRKAEMAEAARKAVEAELRRWREREQKKNAETAARILAESDKSKEAPPPPPPPAPAPAPAAVPKSTLPPRSLGKIQSHKVATPTSKKSLMPNISGLFRRKNQVEGGSPSYLPGEKPLS